MREGLSLVLDYAFKTLALHRVEANIQPANIPFDRPRQAARFYPRGLFSSLPEGRR